MPPSPVVPLDFSNLPLNLIQESVEVHCNTAKFERKQFFQVQLGGDYDEFNVNWLKAKLKKCGVPKTFITKGPDQTRGAKGWAFIGELDPDKPNLSCLNKAVQYFTEPDKQCLETDREEGRKKEGMGPGRRGGGGRVGGDRRSEEELAELGEGGGGVRRRRLSALHREGGA